VADFALELKEKRSAMPGAGRGLFLTFRAPDHTKVESFVLPAGHCVDLGVYAPQLEGDLKPAVIWEMTIDQ